MNPGGVWCQQSIVGASCARPTTLMGVGVLLIASLAFGQNGNKVASDHPDKAKASGPSSSVVKHPAMSHGSSRRDLPHSAVVMPTTKNRTSSQELDRLEHQRVVATNAAVQRQKNAAPITPAKSAGSAGGTGKSSASATDFKYHEPKNKLVTKGNARGTRVVH
jgi:hypothetical protein